MDVRKLDARDDRASFRCGDEALDRFFAQQAGQGLERALSGTYVLAEQDRIDALGKQFKIYNSNAEEVYDLNESNILMPKCFYIEEQDKVIVTGMSTSLATFIDLKNKKVIGQIASALNDNYFIITPELHYMGSKDFIKNMRFKYKSEMFSFEQFDAYLNQPHQVLRSFGCSDSALIRLTKQLIPSA